MQAVPLPPAGLDDPSLYINRELSWLEFNRRVLEEAQDPSVPLLERLKFLAIFESNLDEFFMVRVGGLQQKVQANIAYGSGADRLPVKEQLERIGEVVAELTAQAYHCLNGDVHAVQARAAGDCAAHQATPGSSPRATGTARSEPYSVQEPS